MSALLAVRMFGGDLSFTGWFPVALVVALAALAAVAVGVLYATEAGRIGVVPRSVLAVLRLAVVALVAFLLLRPTLLTTAEERKPRPVAVLIDVSQSMGQRDPRNDPADQWRLAFALGTADPPADGQFPVDPQGRPAAPPRYAPPADQPPWPSRFDLVRSALAPQHKYQLLDRLARHGPLEVSAVGYGRAPVNPADVPKLTPTDPRTALADAVRQAVTRAEPGQRPAAVVLITDGRENVWRPRDGDARGGWAADVAARCREMGVPLHIYGVGVPAVPQALLREVGRDDVVFVDDPARVPVKFRVAGVTRADVVVALHYGVTPQPGGLPEPGPRLTSRTYTLTREQGYGGKAAKGAAKPAAKGAGAWDPARPVLVLREGGREVERQPVDDAGGAEFTEQVLVFTPDKKDADTPNRDLVATVRVTPAGEGAPLADRLSRPVRVVSDKIKVLVIDTLPRWDFKFLQRMLLRDEARLEARFLLLSSDAKALRSDKVWANDLLGEVPRDGNEAWQGGGTTDPTKVTLPVTPEQFRAALFKYDVLVLGDVPDGFFSADHQNVVGEFVAERGGGLIHVAGREYAPASWYRTPDKSPVTATRLKTLSELLPVEFKPVTSPADAKLAVAAAPDRTGRPFFPQLAPGAEADPLVQLEDDPLDNSELWGKPAADAAEDAADPTRGGRIGAFREWGRKLPPLYWHYPVTRLKPAAEVFLVHPTDRTDDGQPMPLMAGHYYGKGYALYVGFDETWRWRLNEAERYFGRFWSQVVFKAGRPRALASRSTQIALDKPSPTRGAGGRVSVTVADRQGRPLTTPGSVKATITRLDAAPGDKDREQTVYLTPGAAAGSPPGTYSAPVTFDKAGKFAVRVEPDGGEPATLEYRVGVPSDDEQAPLGLAEAELRALAEDAGGGFYREENLAGLPDKVAPQSVGVPRQETEVLWNKWFLIAIVALLTAEWIIRKFASLS